MEKKMKTRKGNDGFSYPYTSPDLVVDENGKSVSKKFDEVSSQFKDIAKQAITNDERTKLNSLENYDDTELKNNIQVQKARIDSFTALQDGSTTGDAELIDGRVGADYMTYPNLGDSIRNQFNDIKNDLYDITKSKNMFNPGWIICEYVTYDYKSGVFSVNGNNINKVIDITPFEATEELCLWPNIIDNSQLTSNLMIRFIDTNNTSYQCIVSPSTFYEKVLPTGITIKQVQLYSTGEVSNLKIGVQLEKGNTPTDYVKFGELKTTKFMAKDNFINKLGFSYFTEYVRKYMSYRPLGALNKPYLCIIADDGKMSLLNTTFPLIQEKNIPITFALFKDSQILKNNLADVKNMIQNYGCSVCQHGAPSFVGMSETDLTEFLKTENEYFKSAGINVKGVVYPNNESDALSECVCGSLYGVCAGKLRDEPYNYLNGKTSNLFSLGRISLISASDPKSNLDYAITNNLIMVAYFHDNDLQTQEYYTKVSNFIDYAKSKNVTFITLGDIANI